MANPIQRVLDGVLVCSSLLCLKMNEEFGKGLISSARQDVVGKTIGFTSTFSLFCQGYMSIDALYAERQKRMIVWFGAFVTHLMQLSLETSIQDKSGKDNYNRNVYLLFGLSLLVITITAVHIILRETRRR